MPHALSHDKMYLKTAIRRILKVYQGDSGQARSRSDKINDCLHAYIRSRTDNKKTNPDMLAFGTDRED